MNNNTTKLYTIEQIADWQLKRQSSEVELPNLQRGFVWKVSQIEDLWDSILRGFPIGSFLLAAEEEKNMYLLDGQQRATSIAIGLNDPWKNRNDKPGFWSLKNIPVLWLDLYPKSIPSQKKFTFRVTTQSHPWGYQRANNETTLTASDKRAALSAFRKNPENGDISYVRFSQQSVFPFDADIPVPFCFILEAIKEGPGEWAERLIQLCLQNLPVGYIQPKHSHGDYIEALKTRLSDKPFCKQLFDSVHSVGLSQLPAIIVNHEVLKPLNIEENQDQDPTLFVRLNAAGTRIAGEELLYSIYKAAFRSAKDLVENIAADFINPTLVISLSARLIYSEIKDYDYPAPVSVNEFRKRIEDKVFRDHLDAFIGSLDNSPARQLFHKAISILVSDKDINVPPVLVKQLIRSYPDLFLMLLQWLKINPDYNDKENRNIVGAYTAIAWFSPDPKKYVKAIWRELASENFWNKKKLSVPFGVPNNLLMIPLIKPDILKGYLLEDVINNKKLWDDLYPQQDHPIMKTFISTLGGDIVGTTEILTFSRRSWDNFIDRLHKNRMLVVFCQRHYLNKEFTDFNQMADLDDTNVPWDWDHIYPSSWIYYRKNIPSITKHWNYSIGNLRALSFEENRGEQDHKSPSARLQRNKSESFVLESDWLFWKQLESKIEPTNPELFDAHAAAIIIRMCNMYNEWFKELNIEKLFTFD